MPHVLCRNPKQVTINQFGLPYVSTEGSPPTTPLLSEPPSKRCMPTHSHSPHSCRSSAASQQFTCHLRGGRKKVHPQVPLSSGESPLQLLKAQSDSMGKTHPRPFSSQTTQQQLSWTEWLPATSCPGPGGDGFTCSSYFHGRILLLGLIS